MVNDPLILENLQHSITAVQNSLNIIKSEKSVSYIDLLQTIIDMMTEVKKEFRDKELYYMNVINKSLNGLINVKSTHYKNCNLYQEWLIDTLYFNLNSTNESKLLKKILIDEISHSDLLKKEININKLDKTKKHIDDLVIHLSDKLPLLSDYDKKHMNSLVVVFISLLSNQSPLLYYHF